MSRREVSGVAHISGAASALNRADECLHNDLPICDDAQEEPDMLSGVYTLTEKDWQPIARFTAHSDVDSKRAGEMSTSCTTMLDSFFKFWPLSVMEKRIPAWQGSAAMAEHIQGSMDRAFLCRWLGITLLTSNLGISHRRYFEEDGQSCVNTGRVRGMSRLAFESLLHAIHTLGFEQYREGDRLLDGRLASAADPLKEMRTFCESLRDLWKQSFNPGSVLTADTFVIPYPNNSYGSTPDGLSLAALVDARTHVMLSFEFVEHDSFKKDQMYHGMGAAAACTLRLCEPWHNRVLPRILITNARLGGVPTAYGLMHKNIYSISHVKAHAKHFCKQALLTDARGDHDWLRRNDQAFRTANLRVLGKVVKFYAGVHVDSAAQTMLVGTCGSSALAPQIERQASVNETGHLVRRQRELQQPVMHHIYREHCSAVTVHKGLAFGPGSLGAHYQNVQSLNLKVFYCMLALAETNAYLAFVISKGLDPQQCTHSQFKMELAAALLVHAATLEGEDAAREEAEENDEEEIAAAAAEQQPEPPSIAIASAPVPTSPQGDADAVQYKVKATTRHPRHLLPPPTTDAHAPTGAQGGAPQPRPLPRRNAQPPVFAGHKLNMQSKCQTCVECGLWCQGQCECGATLCGGDPRLGATCYLWHLSAIIAKQPAAAPYVRKRGRHAHEHHDEENQPGSQQL